jgi:hypothetical protein
MRGLRFAVSRLLVLPPQPELMPVVMQSVFKVKDEIFN